ncbi:MAG TPA: hypothetical protein VEZ13_15975 [Brevibacillus sp.]|nr:hypothetical protein [Brevibacillus sp.]
MKAEASAPNQSQPVIVWEGKSEQTGQVIPFPASREWRGQASQEATVSRWEIGPAHNPAIVTQVSSGFTRATRSAASPQALFMRMAA